MLEIKSKEIRAILLYFLLNPHQECYAREMAKKLMLDPANADKALKKLSIAGLLEWKKRGGHRMYSINGDYPLLEEFKKIFLFKYGLAGILAEKLKSLPGLEEAYIYGSYAKNELAAESDIDILLIGDHSAVQTAGIFTSMQKYFDREFNVTDMTKKELNKKKKDRDGFIVDIFKGKTIKIL